jgi:hypothetical protein
MSREALWHNPLPISLFLNRQPEARSVPIDTHGLRLPHTSHHQSSIAILSRQGDSLSTTSSG